MSATDLDLPVLMSADHIRRREFVVTRRGYETAQVRDFLDQVADQMQQLENIVRESRIEADAAVRAAAQPRIDPYAQLASRVAGVLRAAADEAEKLRREASAEAERIVAEARADAERIRKQAEVRADEASASADAMLREARERADRAIHGLSTRRDALVEELASMQERLMGVARELESTISVPEAAHVPPADAVAGSPTAEHEAAEDDQGPSDRTILLHDAATDAPPMDDPEADPHDEAQMAFLDPSFEELWEGPEGTAFDVPNIPPLDLDWDDVDEREDGLEDDDAEDDDR